MSPSPFTVITIHSLTQSALRPLASLSQLSRRESTQPSSQRKYIYSWAKQEWQAKQAESEAIPRVCWCLCQMPNSHPKSEGLPLCDGRLLPLARLPRTCGDGFFMVAPTLLACTTYIFAFRRINCYKPLPSSLPPVTHIGYCCLFHLLLVSVPSIPTFQYWLASTHVTIVHIGYNILASVHFSFKPTKIKKISEIVQLVLLPICLPRCDGECVS